MYRIVEVGRAGKILNMEIEQPTGGNCVNQPLGRRDGGEWW